jgi:AhpD family alkylhydroperoxidase
MRLKILTSGYSFGTKVLFALIHVVSRQPVPDAAKLVFYRPDFYGAPMKEITQEAMRGPSAWSVGDRELMAAFVSQTNECAFCIGAHTATAARAAGVSREQIEDALAISFAFNTTDRLADAFGFFVPGPKAFEAGAKFLLRRGYR